MTLKTSIFLVVLRRWRGVCPFKLKFILLFKPNIQNYYYYESKVKFEIYRPNKGSYVVVVVRQWLW